MNFPILVKVLPDGGSKPYEVIVLNDAHLTDLYSRNKIIIKRQSINVIYLIAQHDCFFIESKRIIKAYSDLDKAFLALHEFGDVYPQQEDRKETAVAEVFKNGHTMYAIEVVELK